MKFAKCAVGAAFAALAAGCSLQPVYQRPAAPVSATFPTGQAYKPLAQGAGAAKLPATDIGWRNFLSDPRLQRLVELGLQNNRDLRVAMLNVEKVQAQYRIQRAALFPQVAAGASVVDSRTPASVSSSHNVSMTHDYSTGLSAAWEIDFFGRLRSLSDAALDQYLASAYARQAAEILLVSQIADQYLTTLAYDEQLTVTQNTPKFANEAQEREFWETHDSTDHLDWSKAKKVTLPNLKPTTKTISLRLPQHLLDSIKVAANARDVPYQSLIKVWLQEKLQGQ